MKEIQCSAGPRARQKVHSLVLGAAILLGAAAGGCTSSKEAAQMLLAPPNQFFHPPEAAKLVDWWRNYFAQFTNPPVAYVSVPVGPPRAFLRAVELPPRDYHMQAVTNMATTIAHEGAFALTCAPTPGDSFTPLPQPRTIFVLHAYLAAKEPMMPWAMLLTRAGYRVVAVDLRGHGQSSGDEITFGKVEAQDLRQLLDYMIAQHLCDDTVGVLGYSYGADIALHWAVADPRVKTVVAIAAYNRPDQAAMRMMKMMPIPITRKHFQEALRMDEQRLGVDWHTWSGSAMLNRMTQPVLLIGGGKDNIVLPEDVEANLQSAPAGSKKLMVENAIHFSVGFWLPGLAEPVTNWFNAHLAGLPPTVTR